MTAIGLGNGKEDGVSRLQEGKGGKAPEQRSKGEGQKRQGLEERFLAKTKGGGGDPDAAFERRLEDMKRRAQLAVKVGIQHRDAWSGGRSQGRQMKAGM